MRLTRTFLILLAAAGSLALLLGAFGFQVLGGLTPCKLCIWQRWPHAAAVVIAGAAIATRSAFLPWLGAIAALTSGAIGVYHTGVERAWWPGPTSCTSSAPVTGSGRSMIESGFCSTKPLPASSSMITAPTSPAMSA